MKKLLATALLSVLPLSSALADQDVGCGLGTMVFEGKSGLAPKVLAATTNGTSGNQTFGITFGTLGCSAEGTITSRQKIALFIDGNLDNLARDMAKGEGETLETLTAVWGVKESDAAHFNAFAQNNFAEIFASENVTAKEVLENLNQLMTADAALAHYSLV